MRLTSFAGSDLDRRITASRDTSDAIDFGLDLEERDLVAMGASDLNDDPLRLALTQCQIGIAEPLVATRTTHRAHSVRDHAEKELDARRAHLRAAR